MPRPKSKANDDPEVSAVRKAMTAKPSMPVKTPDVYLSTGSTLVNLIVSGRANGGFLRGTYNHVVGTSGSGKTFLAATCLAEAARSKRFADYDLIYDGPENGLGMDIETFFGGKAAARIRPPAGDMANPDCSTTLDKLYDNLDAQYKTGRPFVWVLDSMDAIEPEEDLAKAEKQRTARKKGKDDSPGSYGTAKAKMNGAGLRRATLELPKTGSILIIVSQVRDKIGGFMPAFGDNQVYSGGHALKFYAALQLWLSVREPIKKRAKGKDRQIGTVTRIKVKKNRGTGRPRAADVPILYSVGIDDLLSCVDYLLSEGHWKGTRAKLGATPEFGDFPGGSADDLIAHVEENNLEGRLRKLVADVWTAIEMEITTVRKKRFT